MPDGSTTGQVPAVVYFHGGFSLDPLDFEDCRAFLEAGYAVLTPTLRGENGNPGDFELLYGEVDDARAAIAWLATNPEVNAQRIYTFGHSIGGAISALLSLWDDVPVRLSGSAAGLHPPQIFRAWSVSEPTWVPFDATNEIETRLRLLAGNMAYMQTGHIAYMGRDDVLSQGIDPLRNEAEQSGANLKINLVDGDHLASLPPAVAAFEAEIQADLAKAF
jgi:pimeloyl-ACP methyl ester carboxylesterase